MASSPTTAATWQLGTRFASVEGTVKRALYRLLNHWRVRRVLEGVPPFTTLYGGWNRQHPFDREFGTDTSGSVSITKLRQDEPGAGLCEENMNSYAGSQPSIVRRAIQSLPDVTGFTFVDQGCGKGRPLLIATEFPFRDIIGVDLSKGLLSIARSNANAIQQRFPQRVLITLLQRTAHDFIPANDRIVFFCYNSMTRDGVGEFVQRLEKKVSDPATDVFVIYYNPVCGDLFDASPKLSRWFAGVIPYSRSELGFGPDTEDSVVIWQSASHGRSGLTGAHRKIKVVDPRYRADVEKSPAGS